MGFLADRPKNFVGTKLHYQTTKAVNRIDEDTILVAIAEQWEGEINEAIIENATRKKIREIDDHFCRMMNRYQLIWAIRAGKPKEKAYYLKQMTELSCGKPASVAGGGEGGKNRGVVQLPVKDKGGEDE